MRDIKPFVNKYKDISLINDDNAYVEKDVAVVDLCLSFMAEFCNGEPLIIVPSLLQGHLAYMQSEELKKALFSLRQYAGNLSSRLAWRKALANHKRFEQRTAFLTAGNSVSKRDGASEKLLNFLASTLRDASPYIERELKFPQEDLAFVHLPKNKKSININIPKINLSETSRLVLTKRSVNPPILITWEQLYRVASQVDQRETEDDFPAWLEPLNLESRLRRIKISNAERQFNMDQGILLDGVHHVVGMLSSGKSTLLQVLLFALVGSGYQKRVLFLASDTATATKVVARLKAHGINESTVLSSLYNRDEHLSMIHWNAQGFPSDEALNAVAAFTESFGVACPLMGFQKKAGIISSDVDDESSTAEKPCHSIYPSISSKTKLTCPLISQCPTHNQQQQLSDAQVVVMTPQAFLHMTPDKSVVSESISFPELFQFHSDVVLIDEADHVQCTFDRECSQEVDLLSSSEKAFSLSNQRALASSLTERSGEQYSAVTNVKWHHELNRLQSCISATYYLLLQHGGELRWITEGRTFTGLSILADLSKSEDKSEEDSSRDLEQIALLGSMLYAKCSIADNESDKNPDQETLSSKYLPIFNELSDIQDTLIDHVVGERLDFLVERLEQKLVQDDFSPLNVENAREASNHLTGKRHVGRRSVPSSSEAKAYAIVLALLTNWTLSSFTYLVRNQAAVEEDFDLSGDDTFREANRIFRNFGSLIPRPLFGTVFGLTFEPVSDSSQGGTLKLVNHLGVGRYLLTHLNKLLSDESQAGPHVLLVSGTSWAGGSKPDASPIYDVQLPVSAILEQPKEELESLKHSYFEFVSLSENPIRVSGLPPAERKQSLKIISNELVKAAPSGTFLQRKWSDLESRWSELGSGSKNRKRALLVTNNYEDAKCVANQLTASAGLNHSVYCLVSDQSVRKGALKQADNRSIEALSPNVNVVPRSKVEEFGMAPEGSILVAPLTPISRGHNIITREGYAAISTIFFLHRPHPRPDDYSSVIGMVNKLALDFIRGELTEKTGSLESLNRWYTRKAKEAVAKGFDLRTSYSYMPETARTQFAWDLMTSLWQTIGRGIRKGVPVYVGFIDSQFAPGLYKTPPKQDTRHSSCLIQMKETLYQTIEVEKNDVANKLYLPLYNALVDLFENK